MAAPRGLTKPHHFLELLPAVLIEVGVLYFIAAFVQGLALPS